MKKVLVIAYHFPPVGGAGVQRTSKFIKYLPFYNYQPIVITAKEPSVPSYDPSLLKEIPKNVLVLRTPSLEISYNKKQKAWQKLIVENNCSCHAKKLFSKIIKNIIHIIFTPDYQIGWIPFAVFTSIKIIKLHKIDTIFISVPPFSSLLIGIVLKILTKKEWIADFRDEWIEFYNEFYSAHKRSFGLAISKKIERIAVHSAYKITAVTEKMTRNFKLKYPSIHERFIWLPNGFDSEDFASSLTRKTTDKFTLTYTGTLFSVTTPKYLISALKNLVLELPEMKNNMIVNIVGRITDDILPLFDVPLLNGIINIVGYVSHKESISYLMQSDVLILIIDDIPNSINISTGKIFEYLAARKPILALVPKEGEAANLIRSANAGIIVPPRDIENISRQILQLYKNYKSGNIHFSPKTFFISQFDRKSITKKLVYDVLGG